MPRIIVGRGTAIILTEDIRKLSFRENAHIQSFHRKSVVDLR
jgi:hypothetical protein